MQYTDLLKKVRHIEIKAKGLSQQVLAGKYQSRFRGRGMAFSEVRNYHIGDDIRDIDWNVTARHGHPYIKVFEEEREQTVVLMLDLSGSTLWGTQSDTKRTFMIEIAATLAFSAIENNDKVGAILFTDKVEKFIVPRSGRKHILSIISDLLSFEPKSKRTNLDIPLTQLLQAIKKRATVFVISDFLQFDLSYSKNFLISSKKHDMIALRVNDPKENHMPSLGLVQLQDSETGYYRWVDTSSKKIQKMYLEHYDTLISQFENQCNINGIDNVSLTVGTDYVPKLINLFKRRA